MTVLVFLGVTSFDLSILHPYKVLRNAAETERMTGGFVFVTWRHTETGGVRLTVKAEVYSWLELAEIGHLFEQQIAGNISMDPNKKTESFVLRRKRDSKDTETR